MHYPTGIPSKEWLARQIQVCVESAYYRALPQAERPHMLAEHIWGNWAQIAWGKDENVVTQHEFAQEAEWVVDKLGAHGMDHRVRARGVHSAYLACGHDWPYSMVSPAPVERRRCKQCEHRRRSP
ncbi:MAG TPA: hypothetical protein VJA25_02045 [Dehalococcoidia bacterium]|nr:hypothetical protein [Dehalococcoidia bacterium]